MINLHGIDKLTLAVFVPLFESSTLTKAVLNQVDVVRVDMESIDTCESFPFTDLECTDQEQLDWIKERAVQVSRMHGAGSAGQSRR